MQCSLGQVVPITWQNETTWSSSSMCFFLNKKKKSKSSSCSSVRGFVTLPLKKWLFWLAFNKRTVSLWFWSATTLFILSSISIFWCLSPLKGRRMHGTSMWDLWSVALWNTCLKTSASYLTALFFVKEICVPHCWDFKDQTSSVRGRR